MDYCNSYTNLTIQSRKARETLAFVTISHWGTIASIQARFTQTLVELYFTKRSYKEKKAKIYCIPNQHTVWPKVLMQTLFISDVSWSKLTWIEGDCDFTFDHLREPWNPWMTIFAIIHYFEWKISKFLRDFTWNH